MRFATWRRSAAVTAGVVGPDGLHPLPSGTSILDLVRAGLPAAVAAGSAALTEPAVAFDEVQLLPPLEPPTVRDFAAFEQHVDGVSRSVSGASEVEPEWYRVPVFYFSNPYAVIGAHDDVAAPPDCEVLDFELELAVVVGTAGQSISPDDAADHIFGYTIFNDWSARDLQGQEMKVGLGPAKGKDFATTLGPFLVTADELEPYRDSDGFLDLEARVSVNGVVVGHDNFRNMSWTFEELISQASRGTQVRPGDVLGSGTTGNGGCLGELWGRTGTREPSPLRPGDVVEMTIEAVGTVRNTVVTGASVPRVRSARRKQWAQNRRGSLTEAKPTAR